MFPPNEKIIEKKICRLSGQEFVITDKDLEFYNKISPVFNGQKYAIPSPTLCPEERQKRRLVWRNDRGLSLSSVEKGLSMFNSQYGYISYQPKKYWSDDWSPFDFQGEVDFSQSVFSQFHSFDKKVPKLARSIAHEENCDYVNQAGHVKDCYLIFHGEDLEKCYFGADGTHAKYCLDFLGAHDCEFCYQIIDCNNCNNLFFSQNCMDCKDSYFLSSCFDCKYCFGCINLSKKEFCFFGAQLTREEYFRRIKEISFEKHFSIIQERVNKYFLTQFCREHQNKKSENVVGNKIFESQNILNSFDILGGRDMRYCFDMMGSTHNCCDVSSFGVTSSFCFESVTVGLSANNVNYCVECWENVTNLWYCLYCNKGIKDCFLCTGLKQKAEHCIMNKPYSAQEYETLCGKIIDHMRSTGEWGEFFPHELSPFGYNETVAMEYFPMTKEEIQNMPRFDEWKSPSSSGELSASVAARKRPGDPGENTTQSVQNSLQKGLYGSGYSDQVRVGQASGWNWYKEETKNYDGIQNIVPKNIQEYDEKVVGFEVAQKNITELLSGMIKCEVTGKPFRIIKQELIFYIENHLPIPTKHPDQRHKERMNLRNPRKLWERYCMCESCEKIAKETNTFKEEDFTPIPQMDIDSISHSGISPKSEYDGLRRKIVTTYAPERPEKIVCEECYRKLVY